MKIVIDVDKLLAEGRITSEEYVRLKALSVEETGSLGFNILIGFGVIATAGGALALLPSGPTAIVLGLALSVAGLFLSANHVKEWGLLGSLLLLVGSLTAAGGILYLTNGGFPGFLIVTILCLVAAWRAKSGLLAAMAVLSLAATVGAMTAYGHATYMFTIRQPTVMVCLFSVLGLFSYRWSKFLPSDDQRLAIMVARTSLFVVNLGFWVGSLWGDSLWHQGDEWHLGAGDVIPAWVFVVGWAAGLVATGVWAVRNDKRWVVNLLAVFGAIHFYTQYFERLGASPGSILIAGLVALGIALAIVRYNQSAKGAPQGRDSSIGLKPNATSA
jgi:iron complex transport system permease protein